MRGNEFVQVDFGDELERLCYASTLKRVRTRVTIHPLLSKGNICVVVTTEVVMIRVGVVFGGTRWAMIRGFCVRKSKRDFMWRGKTCFFNLMGDSKYRVNGETYHHRHED